MGNKQKIPHFQGIDKNNKFLKVPILYSRSYYEYSSKFKVHKNS